jgi:hypothetical protein
VRLIRIFLSIAVLISVFNPSSARTIGFDPEASFFDFEDIVGLFKKQHKQTVKIIHNDDSPIEILRAEVSDKGTSRFKSLKGSVDDFQVMVQNISSKTILTYEVTWIMKHPFEEFLVKKLTVNSINQIIAGMTQKLEFRKDKYYRDDTYYYVELTKVEFEDGTIWEAPEKEEDFFTQLDSLKKKINTLEEKSIDDMTIHEIKERLKLE